MKGRGLVRTTRYYFPTLREAPSDAQIPSDQLLRRAGFIRPLVAGIFNFLPLGNLVLREIENIVRQEMNRADALEVLMPVMQPRELWEKSGRWESFEPPVMATKDRNGREFCMGPTHEENITWLVSQDVNSYKQLPFTLYQIQTKVRDEIRPRAGLIRVKEFTMKDAYSFDVNRVGLNVSYDKMYDAYVRIFDRLALDINVVQADAGSMGGFDTREFMFRCENGEDTIYLCDSCGYSSNSECAACRPFEGQPAFPAEGPSEKVDTPDAGTIDEVSAMLNMAPQRFVKTLLYRAGDQFIAALVRGDRDLNEMKLCTHLQAAELEMATDAEVEELTGAAVGFAGPIGLPEKVRIIADYEIAGMTNFVVGANATDAHIINVNLGMDFEPVEYADIRNAIDGDTCPECDDGYIVGHRSIELGHIFKLGTRYSEALGAVIQVENGGLEPIVMGCYGIGVSRIVAALVEQHHDDKGIVWPASVAPFQIAILLLDPDDDELDAQAQQLHDDLAAQGVRVIIDDRDERPGVKFKDAELIGFPLQVVMGKRGKGSGQLEIQRRHDGEKMTVDDATAVDSLVEMLAEL